MIQGRKSHTLHKEGWSVDLDNCASEPIHVPGRIQPHGFLFALDEPGLEIRHLSANVPALLDCPAAQLIGRPVTDLLDEPSAARLLHRLGKPRLQEGSPIRLAFRGRAAGFQYDGIVHRNGNGLLLLELEDAAEASGIPLDDIHQRVNEAIDSLSNAPDLDALFQCGAEQVKNLSGYARVMIYRFDADWNGQVVAEAREAHLPPFLGLHYPASDIPAQARALYLNNWLRIIPDVHYEPAPVLPARRGEEDPLDMSSSVLRSVSPIHLQYLKNMGVSASMSVSIIRGGELWGLIACHHETAARLPYAVRHGLELIGRFFSSQLAAMEKFENRDYRRALKSLQPRLAACMRREADFLEGLYRHPVNLLQLARGASGAVIHHRGRTVLVGETPTPEQVDALLDWMRREVGRQAIFRTESLASHYPPAREFQDSASGLLAISIPEIRQSYVLLLKPEVIRTVNWGGNPQKPLEPSADGGRLSPRRSFELWRETVRLQSLPWAPEEVEAAEELRRSIIEIHLERQVESALASNRELDHFAAIVAHDLKEPLRGIASFAAFLEEDLGEALNERSREHLLEIRQLSGRARRLIDDLHEFSRLGRVELSFGETDLDEVLRDVAGRLRPFLRETGTELLVPRPLPVLRCDRARIAEVFANLIVNAAKYNERAHRTVEVGVDMDESPPRFHVRDNGIGIAEQDRERVFRIFERLHPQDRYGGGSGAGLPIVKRIIDRHGGRIWLESIPGQGTSVFFTLAPEVSDPRQPDSDNLQGEEPRARSYL